MKIKMLVHVKGMVNGVRMGPYVLGQEYEVPGQIPQHEADLFMGSAMAEEVLPEPPPEEPAEEAPPPPELLADAAPAADAAPDEDTGS